MNRIFKAPLRVALLASVALTLFALPALAGQSESGEAAAMPPMGRPAQMDQIAVFLGDWNVTMAFRMDPNSDEWSETTGPASTTTVLDGCAQRQDFSCEIMGMPFAGFEILSYNRQTDRFESAWIDNMSAVLTIMHGNFEDDQFVMYGESKMDGKTYGVKSVTDFVSDDEIYWEMFRQNPGSEDWIIDMKSTYTRVK